MLKTMTKILLALNVRGNIMSVFVLILPMKVIKVMLKKRIVKLILKILRTIKRKMETKMKLKRKML